MTKTIAERLKDMQNKTWMYKTKLHKIINYKINDTNIEIVTDKDWFVIPVNKINVTLAEFLAAEEEKRNNINITLFQGNNKLALKDLVIENIEKIKKDPGYIPVAKALNEQLKTMIQMAKLEIEYKKIDRD